MKKLDSVKTNIRAGEYNVEWATCTISSKPLAPFMGKCLNVKNNNTSFADKLYWNSEVFNNIKISDNFKQELLTLVSYGACLQSSKTKLESKSHEDKNFTYAVQLKNGINILLYDNDAQVKKHFNILKKYKRSIEVIKFQNAVNPAIGSQVNSFELYPAYVKKKYEFDHYKIGYNPDSKSTVVKYW